MAKFAVLSAGRLFVKLDEGTARELESPFAASVAARSASIARRNEWKSQGRGARFQMGMEGLPDDLLQPKYAAAAVNYTGLSRGRHGAELIYTLSSGQVSGIFGFSGGEEERMFHGADAHVSEPCCEPNGERVACVVRGKDGQTHIGLYTPGRMGIDVLTAGDALDSAPAWVPGAERIVFESRALGYDRLGQVVDLAPASVHEIDLRASNTSVLVAKEGIACSAPRVGSSGTLYYLQRPVPKPRVHFGALLLDALLFPVRMLVALFHWFNMFSLRYSGKPLVSGRSSRAKQADIRRAALFGNLASAAAEAREDDSDEVQTPKDWQLIARQADGSESVIARGVVCFDLCADESVLWSDGRNVFHRPSTGDEQKLAKLKTVSDLRALHAE